MTALLAWATLAGCGGGSDDEKKPPANLQGAVYPRCDFPAFDKPKVTQVTAPDGGRAWQISYIPPPLSRPRPGRTSNVLITEHSPVLPEATMRGGHSIDVADRRVSFRPRSGGSRMFAATWKTERARYLVLANGDRPTTLKRFIACLP